MSKSHMQKKQEAAAHNIVQDVKEHIFPIGSDTCGGSLFLYLASLPENIFNVYCDVCDKIYDVRNPKEGVIFFVPPEKQVSILKEVYGEDVIEKAWDDKSSPLVTEGYRAIQG